MSKNIVKEPAKNLKENKNPSPMDHQEAFIPVVRKELNTFGKFFIIGLWGLVAFVAGIKLTDQNRLSADKLAELEKKIELLRSKDNQKILQANAEIDTRVSYVKSSLEKKYDEKLYEITSEQRKLLSEKNKMIESLRDEVAYKTLKSGRGIASVPDKVMPYSRMNEDILRYEQNRQIIRLKKVQKRREDNFLASADLSDPKNREAYVDLQEKHKVELYALRQNFSAERRKFRSDKFYVRN